VEGHSKSKSADSAQILTIKRRRAPATNPTARREPRVGLPNARDGAPCVASVALVCLLVPHPLLGRDVDREFPNAEETNSFLGGDNTNLSDLILRGLRSKAKSVRVEVGAAETVTLTVQAAQ